MIKSPVIMIPSPTDPLVVDTAETVATVHVVNLKSSLDAGLEIEQLARLMLFPGQLEVGGGP